jgi:hypothetical protein
MLGPSYGLPAVLDSDLGVSALGVGPFPRIAAGSAVVARSAVASGRVETNGATTILAGAAFVTGTPFRQIVIAALAYLQVAVGQRQWWCPVDGAALAFDGPHGLAADAGFGYGQFDAPKVMTTALGRLAAATIPATSCPQKTQCHG